MRSNPGSTVVLKLTDNDEGPQGGHLLTVVGVDPNNAMYPIAYAIVENENKDSWVRFLSLLQSDLEIDEEYAWSFMSDKQKGLIPFFESLFPNAENRFYVRHLHSNIKRDGFTGQSLKNALWAAARATRIEEFKAKMEQLKELDEKAYNVLAGTKASKQWSRHTISAIWCRNEDPEDYVHDVYKVSTYLRCYEHAIQGVNGAEFWPKCELPPPLPPKYKNKPGRSKKMRRRQPDEPPTATNTTRLKKCLKSLKCGKCGVVGHNARTCSKRSGQAEEMPIRRSQPPSTQESNHTQSTSLEPSQSDSSQPATIVPRRKKLPAFNAIFACASPPLASPASSPGLGDVALQI
ncbi:UNVERIFIED_CONTAM: hypothetical protein Slati_0011300 [Sesamum latifolium]|uniref:MULE transposase domain-containing protein n=1 Tax=Sesamum latifolium TaxID=2727402 RepID=A0AAW2Y5X4_9LAMI